GDTAALLEHSRDGLYTVSLGNLGAGETALVRFRFAQLLSFDGGRLRAAIPTAIAPRYGNAETALSAHQVPVTDLQAEYPLSLQLVIRGPLAHAPISSPTHALITTATEGAVTLQLKANATLDRDLVLLIDRAQAPTEALIARDGEGYVGLLTLQAPTLEHAAATPRHLKLLVDCSGSMEGDGIRQAAEGLKAVIAHLNAGDQVSLTRFGSRTDAVTKGLQAITPARRSRLNGRIHALQADLGGTELAVAITTVLNIPVPAGAQADILLITDGEVWDLDRLLAQVAATAQRLFVIAVSATPVEELARKIASTTGGACEFVTPGEDMQAAVARQLQRMAVPTQRVLSVDWGAPVHWTVGLQQPVYAGDTVQLMAGFANPPQISAQVRIGAHDTSHAATLSSAWSPMVMPADTLARLAAARRLLGLQDKAAAALAEQYALICAWTSCVVVLVRDEDDKASTLPALRTVPQMLAAGHMGSGVVADQGVYRMRSMRRRGAAEPVANRLLAFYDDAPIDSVFYNDAPIAPMLPAQAQDTDFED
ncbi:MAG: VWA domain-containing protein, partial [Betaproteobacteria bacterium]